MAVKQQQAEEEAQAIVADSGAGRELFVGDVCGEASLSWCQPPVPTVHRGRALHAPHTQTVLRIRTSLNAALQGKHCCQCSCWWPSTRSRAVHAAHARGSQPQAMRCSSRQPRQRS